MTDGPGDRLRKAIKRRGYRTVADFAKAVAMEPVTVRQHINRNSIPSDAAHLYTKRLKVALDWLLYGEGPDPFVGAEGDNLATNTSKVIKKHELSPRSTGGDDDKEAILTKNENDRTGTANYPEGSAEDMRIQLFKEINGVLFDVTTEELREIRQFLAFKGYLKSPDSEGAVQQRRP